MVRWYGMQCQSPVRLHYTFLPRRTSMIGLHYVETSQDNMVIYMAVHRCSVIRHDGAPWHRSKAVTRTKVTVLYWPGNSPDLNSIQKLWILLRDKVAEKNTFPSLDWSDKVRVVQWHIICLLHIPNQHYATLYSIYNNKNKGGHCRYRYQWLFVENSAIFFKHFRNWITCIFKIVKFQENERWS